VTRLLAILAFTTAVAAVAHGDELPEQLADAEPVSELHKLPLESGIDAMPSWAPSGAKIVFHARRRVESKDVFPTRKIWVVDRDGTNPHKLSEGAGEEYHASYSPDGTKILFVAETNGSRDVWVMTASRSSTRRCPPRAATSTSGS
jgi:Tol biopolymer transport system component